MVVSGLGVRRGGGKNFRGRGDSKPNEEQNKSQAYVSLQAATQLSCLP